MMEEGVNMIKELIKIKENNNIVSIFCDEDDTSMFLEGYIYAIGRQDFLIKHITPHGLADGYILKKIDSVMHLEISGQYEKKIEKLYSKKNQRHIDLKLQDKVSLKNNIFQICMNINVNIKMYIFDHLRMYIFAILPLDRYIFLSDKIFL